MANAIHSAATPHLPLFITEPGQTDVMMAVMAMTLLAAILAAGVFFFWLHSLPERMVHHKVQFDLVAVLALLSLFTHIHAFWIAALLLAFIDIPDLTFPHFGKSFERMATSLEEMSAPKTEPPARAAPSPPVAANPTTDKVSTKPVASANVEV